MNPLLRERGSKTALQPFSALVLEQAGKFGDKPTEDGPIILNEFDQLAATLKQLGCADAHISEVVAAVRSNPKRVSDHVRDLQKVVYAIRAAKADEAIRLLVQPDYLRACPPYQLAKLKKALNDFNAISMSWRKS